MSGYAERQFYKDSRLLVFNNNTQEAIIGVSFFKTVLFSKYYDGNSNQVFWERDGFKYTDDKTIEVRTIQIPSLKFQAESKECIQNFVSIFLKWKSSMADQEAKFEHFEFNDIEDVLNF